MASKAVTIRDAVFELVKEALEPSFQSYRTFRTAAVLPLSPEEIPALSVFFLRDTGVPDGDYNIGEPGMVSDATIGISIQLMVNDPDRIERYLDEESKTAIEAVLTNADFMRLSPDALHEGLSAISRSHHFFREAQAIMAEARIVTTFRYREHWQPVITDHYKRTRITTRPLGHGTNTPAATTVIEEDDWS